MLELQELSERIIAAAIHVHRTLGPGFIEKIYEEALCHAFRRRGIGFIRQYAIDILFEGVKVGDHQLDLFVGNEMVVELKAVRAIDATHFSKVRSYLRAVNKQHGLILNFALPRLEIKRVISSANPPPDFLTSCLPERKKGKEAGPEDAEPLE